MGFIAWSARFPGEGNNNPLQYSCLENPMNWGAWRATVHRVAKSQTQLKQLSIHAKEMKAIDQALFMKCVEGSAMMRENKTLLAEKWTFLWEVWLGVVEEDVIISVLEKIKHIWGPCWVSWSEYVCVRSGAVEVINRFKGLDLIDRVPDELWTEVRDILQEIGIKTVSKKKECKKVKWLSEEALQIAEKRNEK